MTLPGNCPIVGFWGERKTTMLSWSKREKEQHRDDKESATGERSINKHNITVRLKWTRVTLEGDK